MRTLVRSLTASLFAGGLALTAVPALAQTSASEPTVYRFDLPKSVKAQATTFTLPGDLTTRKSRGDRNLGSLSLAESIREVTQLKAKGHAVGGTVTVGGRTREMKGMPTVLADGSVKVRVAQARGSRTLLLRGRGGSSSVVTCVPGYYTMYNVDGTVTCIPYTQ